MITGSHNPPEFNGFKVCVGKETLYGEQIQNLRKIIESENFVEGQGSVSFQEMTGVGAATAVAPAPTRRGATAGGPFCAACGGALPTAARFCPLCGRAQGGPAA